MGIVVQKFGGTSVADAAKIRRAAQRAIRAVENGNNVVMVCSARGKQTDRKGRYVDYTRQRNG